MLDVNFKKSFPFLFSKSFPTKSFPFPIAVKVKTHFHFTVVKQNRGRTVLTAELSWLVIPCSSGTDYCDFKINQTFHFVFFIRVFN